MALAMNRVVGTVVLLRTRRVRRPTAKGGYIMMRRWIWGLLALCALPLLAADLHSRPGGAPPAPWTSNPSSCPGRGSRTHPAEEGAQGLVVYERGSSSSDKGAQYGILVNQLQGFERWLNQTLPPWEKLKLKIIYIPVPGTGCWTISPRGAGIWWPPIPDGDADPARAGHLLPAAHLPIEEWVVSQRELPAFNRITQLSGRRIWVRASSSYHESLHQLNWLFPRAGAASRLHRDGARNTLQDGDLLEMVAAGIIPLTVTDSFKGRIWLDMIGGASRPTG